MFRVILCVGIICMAGTVSAREYHVSVKGHDLNKGTEQSPFKTIGQAASIAQPGDVITVHEGVYREQVNPPRGGESDRKRIVYQAAKGEKVVIKGSEQLRNWVKVENDTWKLVLPNSYFGAFNPYSDEISGDWFNPNGRKHHTGAVYVRGHWLKEASTLKEVLAPVVAGTADSYLMNIRLFQIKKQDRAALIVNAADYVENHGTQIATSGTGEKMVGWIKNGHWIKFKAVDFGSDSEKMFVQASSGTEGGVIEIREGAADGALLGSCNILNTGGWNNWSLFPVKLESVSGLKDIVMVFKAAPKSDTDCIVDIYKTCRWFGSVVNEKTNDITTIWAQFIGIDPNSEDVEINVRQTVFYPDQPGRNYITVRGFTMEHAATPWAPPTAEQKGLIGTHWSKGWIIENNVIRFSRCCGIALGKYGDEWDNAWSNAEKPEWLLKEAKEGTGGYIATTKRGLKNGWNKETIGSHIIRNNKISHCEQTGIVGSLGCAFSTITGNEIHDVHVHRLFSGFEMSGIKLHGAVDVLIKGNHIYRCNQGIWLDWMAQGARVTGNLMHDNIDRDLFMEVNHGPFLIDNNILLSGFSILSCSQGGAYAHNLITGGIAHWVDQRKTPFHPPHSTELAGLHHNQEHGDDRYYNNIIVQKINLTMYDGAKLPVFMDGNVFLAGAVPSIHEKAALVKSDYKPGIGLVNKDDGVYLEYGFDSAWVAERTRKLVNTKLLGKAVISGAAYEQADGKSIRMDRDYFGRKRDKKKPAPGPFAEIATGRQLIRVWPISE